MSFTITDEAFQTPKPKFLGCTISARTTFQAILANKRSAAFMSEEPFQNIKIPQDFFCNVSCSLRHYLVFSGSSILNHELFSQKRRR
jgi:hypothetical protein